MIRKIKEEDLTKVMSLWIKGNFQGNYFIEKDYWLEIYNKTKNLFLDKYNTYIYEENNNILGFVSIFKNEVKAISVEKSNRRRGIGRKLINFCQDKYINLTVTVFEKNVNAFLFFSAIGFKNINIGLNKDFKEKEYLMEKKK